MNKHAEDLTRGGLQRKRKRSREGRKRGGTVAEKLMDLDLLTRKKESRGTGLAQREVARDSEGGKK